MIGYYINDRFILDDGTKAGINIMLYGGKYDMDYWFDEHRCKTLEEADEFIKDYGEEMIEVELKHPIANRSYKPEDLSSFE